MQQPSLLHRGLKISILVSLFWDSIPVACYHFLLNKVVAHQETISDHTLPVCVPKTLTQTDQGL